MEAKGSMVPGIWCGFLFLALLLGPCALQAQVAITEILYNPSATGTAGQYQEYIEIYNTMPEPIDLSGWYFSKGIDFTFEPGIWLDARSYLVVCADLPTFQADHPGVTNVVGSWSRATALDNGGETIALSEISGVEIVRVKYNDRGQWPAAADGTGFSLAIKSPHKEPDDPDSWAVSKDRGGSPGAVNPAPRAATVLVNEALIWTNGAKWVEIYNPTGGSVNLQNYYITDDPRNLTKARIAASSPVPSRGWRAFDAADLGLAFQPDAALPGGRRFIALVDPTGTFVLDAYNFEPSVSEDSEARYPDGNDDWAPAASPTKGAANQVDVETEVVIHEIMYHPIGDDTSKEYVELYNRGSGAVALTGCRFSQGIHFDFPTGTSIPAGEYLVVARTPEKIRQLYGLPAERVIGPAQDAASLDAFGVLSNSGERITLVDGLGNVMDTVRYYGGGDWPKWPDGLGSSLELIDPFADNSAASAWDSSDDAAKAQAKTFSFTGRHVNADESELALVMMNRGIAIVDDIAIRSTQNVVEDQTLVPFGASWRYKKGTEEASSPVDAWRQRTFTETGWTNGIAPLGYGPYTVGFPVVATTFADMQQAGGFPGFYSFFVRKTFTVADPAAIDRLFLDVRFDDGYIAYINGQRVDAMNTNNGSAYNAAASIAAEPGPQLTDITAYKSSLVAGTNVLAIQVHNGNLTSSDAYLDARLYTGRIEGGGQGPNLIPNNGDFEVSAAGWRIDGNHIDSGRTMTQPITGTGSLKLIATARGDNKVDRLECDTNPSMNGTDTYTVSFKARWVIGSRTILTHDFQNLRTSLAASHQLLIPENLGTPGAQNSVTARRIQETGSDDLGPTIAKVSHSPEVPQGGAAVTVKARVSDPDGVASVKAKYFINTPGISPIEVPMTDPDGDGFYSGTIPGQVLGRKVLYSIDAADANGHTERFPPDVTQRTHPLILDPQTTDPAVQSYLYYRHVVSDPAPGDTAYKLRIILHDLNDAYLDQRMTLSNDPVEGALIFGTNELYQNVRIRFSGSPWARGQWQSFRIRFPGDRLYQGTTSQFNLELNQGGGSPAHQRLSHYLFRSLSRTNARVPYTYLKRATVWANDRALGSRDQVMVPSGDLISMYWPDEDKGDLFEVDDRFELSDAGGMINSRDAYLRSPPQGDEIDNNGDNPENYRWYFNLRQDEDADNYGNLMDLALVMDPGKTSNANFNGAIDQFMNLENFLRNWAVRTNTDDWDSWGASRGKNCYLYRPPLEGRWYLIPWDMELTYGSVDSFVHPTGSTGSFGFGFPEVNRLLNQPRIRRLYYGILKEMVEGPFRSSALGPYMAQLDAMGIAGTEAGKPGGFVDQRRSLILNWINPVTRPTVNLSISSPTNNSSTTSQKIKLAGTAPVEMFQVTVTSDASDYNGGEVPPTFFPNTSMTAWEINNVPLAPGANNLTVIGSSSQSELLDSRSVRVTLNVSAPTIASLSPDTGAAGSTVVITGTNIFRGVQVLFGTTPAVVSYDPLDTTRVQAIVPDLASGPITITLKNKDGKASNGRSFTVGSPVPEFIRGDANLDLWMDISDVVRIIFVLYADQTTTCPDALDTNDDGLLNSADAIYDLQYLFQDGPPPTAPFPQRGVDPSADPLECISGLP